MTIGNERYGSQGYGGGYSTESFPVNISSTTPTFVSGPHQITSGTPCFISTELFETPTGYIGELVREEVLLSGTPSGSVGELQDELQGLEQYSQEGLEDPSLLIGGYLGSHPAKTVAARISSIGCYMDGAYVSNFISSDIEAFIYGWNYIPSTLDIYLRGHLGLADSIDTFILGHQSTSASVDIFMEGVLARLGILPAYILCIGDVSATQSAFIHGYDNTNEGVAYSDKVIASSPVAYWRLDETSGTTIYDSVGPYDGETNNSPTLGEQGAIDDGTSIYFNGSNQNIALPKYYNTSGALPEFSAECWVKTTFSGANYSDNWALIDFDRSEYFNFYVEGSGIIGFSTTDTSSNIHDQSGSTVVNDGEWHHVVAVYDGTDKIIYVDGVEDSRSNNPHSGRAIGSGTTRYGFIGSGSEAGVFNGDTGSIYYEGHIDEVALYESVLTQEEVESHATLTFNVPTLNMFVEGRKAVTLSTPLFVSGHLAESSSTSAHIHSIGASSVTKIVYIHGDRFNLSSFKRSYIRGGNVSQVGIIRPYLLLSYINGSSGPTISSNTSLFIVSYGLIGEWDLNDGLESPFTTKVDDTSSTDNDGNIYGGATWITGPHCEGE